MNAFADTNASPRHQLQPEQWITLHRDMLIQFALRKVSSSAVAEDLVQETFLSAWKARERFRGDSTERTFLVSILRNKIADHYRLAHNRLSRPASEFAPVEEDEGWNWMDLHALEPEHQHPDARTDHADFLGDLEEAIETLPDTMRRVFKMRELQGKSTDEITSELEISRNNLWVIVHRAKQHLADLLGPKWEPAAA